MKKTRKQKDKRQKTKDKRQKTKRNKRNKKFTGGGYCGHDPMNKEEFQSVLVKLNLDKDDLQLTTFISNIKDEKLKNFLIYLTSIHYADEIYTEKKHCASLRILLTNFSETLPEKQENKPTQNLTSVMQFFKKKPEQEKQHDLQFDEDTFIEYLTDNYKPYNEYIENEEEKERDQMIAERNKRSKDNKRIDE
jgi:hypothetical protein